jgi:hypothetical protein
MVLICLQCLPALKQGPSLGLQAHAVPKGTVSLDCLGVYVLTSMEA